MEELRRDFLADILALDAGLIMADTFMPYCQYYLFG
jgi:hypothetical protein